jgi:siroheme synthase
VDTIVVLMGLATLPQIVEGLTRGGRSPQTPAAIVENGTWDDERTIVTTLGELAVEARSADVRSPATVVIGDVVNARVGRVRERVFRSGATG